MKFVDVARLQRTIRNGKRNLEDKRFLLLTLSEILRYMMRLKHVSNTHREGVEETAYSANWIVLNVATFPIRLYSPKFPLIFLVLRGMMVSKMFKISVGKHKQ